MYEYIVFSYDRGSTHLCITFKEAIHVKQRLTEIGVKASIYKRMEDRPESFYKGEDK